MANECEKPLRVDSLVLNPLARTVHRHGKRVELQAKQFDLLVYLMRHPYRVVTKRMLAQGVWKDETTTWTNIVEVTVCGLRKRIESPEWRTIVHTVRGCGYLLGESPPEVRKPTKPHRPLSR